MEIIPQITDIGRQAVLTADGLGLSAKISHIAFGSGSYDPLATTTALQSEVVRVAVDGGKKDLDTIQMTCSVMPLEDFVLGEIGVFLETGEMLAVWSHGTKPLTHMTQGIELGISFSLILSALPREAITIAVANPPSIPDFTLEFARITTATNNTRLQQIKFNEKEI